MRFRTRGSVVGGFGRQLLRCRRLPRQDANGGNVPLLRPAGAPEFLAIDAGLGRTEQALEEATRRQLAKKHRPGHALNRAASLLSPRWAADLAMAELNKLVDRPSGGNEGAILPSYGDFRRSPLWDPLRNDPAFEALVQRLAPTRSK